jgi:hypothetical protein
MDTGPVLTTDKIKEHTLTSRLRNGVIFLTGCKKETPKPEDEIISRLRVVLRRHLVLQPKLTSLTLMPFPNDPPVSRGHPSAQLPICPSLPFPTSCNAAPDAAGPPSPCGPSRLPIGPHPPPIYFFSFLFIFIYLSFVCSPKSKSISFGFFCVYP